MNFKYYLAAIGAFTIWGFFSLPLRALQAYPAFDILGYRILVTLGLMVVIIGIFRRKALKHSWKEFIKMPTREKKQFLLIHFLSGLIFATNWFLFIYVMNNVSVNATSLAYLICPIMTVVFSFFLLKEPLTKTQWIAVFICFASCMMMTVGHFMELFYSTIVALSYAFYPILQRKNRKLDRFIVLTTQVFFAVILLLPLFPYYMSPIEKTFFFYEVVLLIAVLFTLVPMYLTIASLKGLNSSVVGFFIFLNPIFSFLLAIFYFKENLSLVQGIAYALILLAVIMFNEKVIRDYLLKKNRRLKKSAFRSKTFNR